MLWLLYHFERRWAGHGFMGCSWQGGICILHNYTSNWSSISIGGVHGSLQWSPVSVTLSLTVSRMYFDFSVLALSTFHGQHQKKSSDREKSGTGHEDHTYPCGFDFVFHATWAGPMYTDE